MPLPYYHFPPNDEQEENTECVPQYAQHVPTAIQGSQLQYPGLPTQSSAIFTQQQLPQDDIRYLQLMQLRQQQYYQLQLQQQATWTQPAAMYPYTYSQQVANPGIQYAQAYQYSQTPVIAGPSGPQPGYLAPRHNTRPDLPRSMSTISNTSSADEESQPDDDDESSNDSEMARWGRKNRDGSWSCSYPGCSSSSTFMRGCDLRKHYKRHEKKLACRWMDCPKAAQNSFSSKKDRDRHEARHNPTIFCSQGCGKVFSREDNMRDHARRIHGVGLCR